MSNVIFYKYKSFTDDDGKDISQWTFDSLIHKYFYFSRPEQLNDPLDCKVLNEYNANDDIIENWISKSSSRHFLTVDSIRQRIDSGKFQNSMEASARKDEQHFHVLSLTDSWQNLHMWEKYASCFEGICIGYNSSFTDEYNYHYIEVNAIIKDVPIVESFRNIDDKGYFELQKVQYDNDGKHKYNVFKSDDKANRDNIAYALLHKTEAWKEENEYRKIIVDKLNPFQPDNFVPKDLLVFYPDNVLAEINFGYKCNPEMQDVLIKCIKKHYSVWEKIQMYSVKILETNGSLYREKIENA